MQGARRAVNALLTVNVEAHAARRDHRLGGAAAGQRGEGGGSIGAKKREGVVCCRISGNAQHHSNTQTHATHASAQQCTGKQHTTQPAHRTPLDHSCQRPPRCRWRSRSQSARLAALWSAAVCASGRGVHCSSTSEGLEHQAGGRGAAAHTRMHAQACIACVRSHLDDAGQRRHVGELLDRWQEAAMLRGTRRAVEQPRASARTPAAAGACVGTTNAG